MPDDHAALESWLLKIDPHAGIQARKDAVDESLGLLSIRDGDETIVVPLSGGPAWSSGLRSAIRLIDKSALEHNTISGIKLDDGKYIELVIVPASVRFGGVEIQLLGRLPTMRVTGFVAGKTVRSARYKLKNKGYIYNLQTTTKGFENRWVLDLRYCAGGDIFEATDFGGLWLKERAHWTSINNQGQTPVPLETGGRGHTVSPPVAILVSRYTASSCEQLVMGLRKYTQVVVLGEQTAGKCSVQTTTPLSGGYWLRITTGSWSGPGEEPCNESGLMPDLTFTGNLHSHDEVDTWLTQVFRAPQDVVSQ